MSHCAFVPYLSLSSCICLIAYHPAQNFFSYSLDPAHLPLSAESYDAVVYRFLTNIMTRKNDSRDTYIILRSDHGLQGERYHITLER